MKKFFKKFFSVILLTTSLLLSFSLLVNVSSNSKNNIQNQSVETYANGTVNSASPTTITNTSATITYSYTIATAGDSDDVTFILYQGSSEAGTVVQQGATPASETTSTSYILSLTGLTINTNYFLEFYVGGVLQTSSVVTFQTTNSPSAQITSASTTAITNTTADIQYQYDYIDSSAAVEPTYALYKGTTTAGGPIQSGPTTAVENNTDGLYTLSLTGLDPNQDYFVLFSIGGVVQDDAIVTFKTTNNFDGIVSITGSSAFDNNSGVVSYSYTKATGTGSNNVTYSVYEGSDNTGAVVPGYDNVATPPNEETATTSLNFKITGLADNSTYTIEFFVNGVTQGTTTFTTSNNHDGLVGLISTTPKDNNTSVTIGYRYTLATGTGVDTVTYTLYEGTNNSGLIVPGHNNVETPITEVTGDSNTFDIDGLVPNTDYYIEFKVNGVIQGGRAFKTANNYDGQVTQIKPKVGLDNNSIIVGYDYLQATGTGSDDVTVSIYEGSDNTGTVVPGYNNSATVIDESLVGDGYYEFTVTGLKPDTRYYIEFYVNGVFQGSQLIKTSNNFDGSVSSINITPSNTTAQITYNFQLASGTGSNELKYTLYYGNDATVGNEVSGYINISTPITEVAGSNTFTITSLTPNTNYYIDFEINNISIGGQAFTTTNNYDAKVSNLTMDANSNNTSVQVNYYYEAALGSGSTNVTYKLYEGTDNNSPIVNGHNNQITPPTENASGNYSFTISSLKPNTTYYMEIYVNGVFNDSYQITTQNNFDAQVQMSKVTYLSDSSATIEYVYTAATGTGSNDISYELWLGQKNTGTLLISESTPSNETINGTYQMSLIELTENTEYTVVYYVNGIYEEELSFKTYMTVDAEEMMTSEIIKYEDGKVQIQVTCKKIDLNQKLEYKLDNGEWTEVTFESTDLPYTYLVWIDLADVNGYFSVSWKINNITQNHVTQGEYFRPSSAWPLWLIITVSLSSVIFFLLLVILAMWIYYHYRRNKNNDQKVFASSNTTDNNNPANNLNSNKLSEKSIENEAFNKELASVQATYHSKINSTNTQITKAKYITNLSSDIKLATLEQYTSENNQSRISSVNVVQVNAYEVTVSFEYETKLEHYPWVTYSVYEGVNRYGRSLTGLKDVNVKIINAKQKHRYEFTLKNLKPTHHHFIELKDNNLLKHEFMFKTKSRLENDFRDEVVLYSSDNN